MCVIVVKPKGVKLKRIYWAECFRMNGHGAGLSYVEDNQLVVDKGYFVFDELYKEIEKHEDKEMVVHFRISSAGSITPGNCHPFFVQSEAKPEFAWAISHNGTLDYLSSKDESDTNMFVNQVLGPQLSRDPWFLDQHPGQHFLKMACRAKYVAGNDSKIVVFRYDSEAKESNIYIANKQLGVDEMGCWFSNSSFRLPMVYHGYTRGGGMHGMGGDWDAEDDRFFVGKGGFMSDKDWSKHGYHLNAQGRWEPNRHRVISPRQVKPLAPALPLLLQQDHLKINAELTKSDSSGNKPIEVPRDDEIEAMRKKEVRFNQRLDHLSKKGRRIMRRLATDYAKSELDEIEFIKLSTVDAVICFRDTVRFKTLREDIAMKEDKVLDQWIVDQAFKCFDNPQLNIWTQLGLDEDGVVNPPNDIHEGPEGPDDIDEAVGADARLGHVEQFPVDGGHGDPINM